MPNERDPRIGRTSRNRAGKSRPETEEEKEMRLGQELRYLMRDPRYAAGDADYQAYVHRQYRRVYDDPSGKPASLRIGRPKTFANHIESFDSASERRLRMGNREYSIPSSGRVGPKSLSSGPKISGDADIRTPKRHETPRSTTVSQRRNKASRKTGSNILAQEDRALIATEEGPVANRPMPSRAATEYAVSAAKERANSLGSHEARESSLRAIRSAQSFIHDFDIEGHHTSADLLRHYLLGTGSTVVLPADFLDQWSPAQNAVSDVDGHFEAWLMGQLADDRFGSPILTIQDGERIFVGGDESGPAADPGDRIKWEATFAGIGDAVIGRGNQNHQTRDFIAALTNLDFFNEAMTTFGGGTAQGFGYFVLERHGDTVTVGGLIDYRFRDTYKFDWADTFNPGFRHLQSNGIAKEFEIYTTPMRSGFNATIQLENGDPVSITIDRSEPKPL